MVVGWLFSVMLFGCYLVFWLGSGMVISVWVCILVCSCIVEFWVLMIRCVSFV